MQDNLYTYPLPTRTRPKHGLFFAVMVPLPEAEKISRLFDGLRTRYIIRKPQIPCDRLHVSLFHILAADSLPERVVQTSLFTGSAIRFVEFDLALNRLLTFRNTQEEKPLVLAADVASSRTTNSLTSQLRQTFSILSGLPIGRTAPIKPHVTLVWDHLSVPEQPNPPPITLPVREVALIHSHIGKSRYDILGSWRLVPR
jgi:RNA 2',3'-cyclic 3'-phosphodiesterase